MTAKRPARDNATPCPEAGCVQPFGANGHTLADSGTIPEAPKKLRQPILIHRDTAGREWTRYGPFVRAQRPGRVPDAT